MSLDLNQSNVALDNSVFSPMLENLQANILKGHGRKFAHHLFFQFKPSKATQAKTWIAAFAKNNITSAKTQIETTELFNAGTIPDGGTVYTLSLSATGYDALGLTTKPASSSFNNGMKSSANLLGDDKNIWELYFQNNVHLLIIIADDQLQVADTKAKDIVKQTKAFATLLHDQKGNVLKMKNGIGIEHFGYADGISQPLYLKDDIDRQISTKEWDDTTNLSLLLVPDPGTSVPDSFGSYLVFRKLEQNVKGFKTGEGDNGSAGTILPPVINATGVKDQDLSGALLVGRFENSVPVVKKSTDEQSNPPVVTNDFNYADDLAALKCPFHSHIRLMNPRKGDTIAGDVSSRRITRRAIPYDEVKRIPLDKITEITDEMLNKKQPTGGVGLLFMCYQSSIEDHFEILQGFWAKGQIGTHAIGAQDSLISQGSNPKKTVAKEWGKAPQSDQFKFDGFVKTKGGEYFFSPSLSFLRTLV